MRIPYVNVNFEGVKVACVGDSLTYGTTLLNRKVESYPARLAKSLGKGYDVVNFGFAGYALNRHSAKCYLNLPVLGMLEQYSPDYVIMLLGTNDARQKNFTAEVDFANAFRAIITAIKNLSSKPQLIAMTCPMAYVDTNLYEFDFSHENLYKVVQIQKTILNEYKVPYIDLYSITKGKTSLYAEDMLHFNSKGAKFLAYRTYTAIKEFENKEK
ncbi:MAG: hypothetical protein K2M75_06935 [Clostridia bacterium]|nr:hypothetical protein [Clostridia bacterium]